MNARDPTCSWSYNFIRFTNVQPIFCLQLAMILGRFPGIAELVDAKLFISKELDAHLKPSSKLKYASDFISIGKNDN